MSGYLHESQEFTCVLNNRETFENLFQDTLREKICKLQKNILFFLLCKYCLKERKKSKKDLRYLIYDWVNFISRSFAGFRRDGLLTFVGLD